MRPRESRHAGPAPIRWQAYAAAALVVIAILFGGGGAEGPVNNGVIQALSAILLALLVASHVQGSWPLPSSARWAAWLLLALLLLVVIQIVPLPPSMWRSLPGRELAGSSLALVGSANEWRPLSLDPEGTRLFAASLLLPAVLLYGVLGATRREVLLVLRAIVAAAGLSALIGALQLTLGSPSWLTYYEGPNPSAASGVFANSNQHSTLLVGAILILALLIRADRSGSGRPPRATNISFHPAWLAIPFFIIMTLATGSRAGMVLLALAVPGALLIAVGRQAPMLWLGGVAAVLLLVVATISFSPSGNLVAAGQSFIFSEDTRYDFLPDVLYTLRQYWPWGSGLGTFVPVFAPNENLDVAGAAYVNHAHNDLLEWLIETGIPGAAWLLAVAAILVWRLASVARNRAQVRGTQFAAVLTGAWILILIAVHSTVEYPLRAEAISAVAAIAIGIMFAPLTDAPPRPVSAGGRAWPLIVGGASGLLVAALVLRIFVAEAAVRNDNGALALSLRPTNGQALALAAEQQLKAGQPDSARRLAKAAIERAPLTSSAIRVLAMAAPNTSAGIAAWRVASAMGWRDGPTQLWAFQQALANAEYEVSAVRADAFLRTRSNLQQQYLTIVRTAAMDPRFRQALIGRIELRPGWRETLFEVPPEASNEELQGTHDLLVDLAATGAVASRGEAAATISHLIDRRQYDAAAGLYRRIRGVGSPGSELLDDGGFDRPVEDYRTNSTPFDWRLTPVRGATATIEEQNGRHLFLETDGSANRILLRRYVPLAAGAYRLDYMRRGEAESPEAIATSIRCVDGPQLATSTNAPLQGSAFEPRQLRFNVASNCPMIAIAFEAKAVGRPATAEFDEFSLERVP